MDSVAKIYCATYHYRAKDPPHKVIHMSIVSQFCRILLSPIDSLRERCFYLKKIIKKILRTQIKNIWKGVSPLLLTYKPYRAKLILEDGHLSSSVHNPQGKVLRNECSYLFHWSLRIWSSGSVCDDCGLEHAFFHRTQKAKMEPGSIVVHQVQELEQDVLLILDAEKAGTLSGTGFSFTSSFSLAQIYLDINRNFSHFVPTWSRVNPRVCTECFVQVTTIGHVTFQSIQV